LPTLLHSKEHINRSCREMNIPEAILKFGIFAWQLWGRIGMPRLLAELPFPSGNLPACRLND